MRRISKVEVKKSRRGKTLIVWRKLERGSQAVVGASRGGPDVAIGDLFSDAVANGLIDERLAAEPIPSYPTGVRTNPEVSRGDN
jgi:hypothetical protein